MIRVTSLLTAAVLLCSLPLVAADKDDKKKPEQKSEPKATGASDYVSVGEFEGVISRGPGSKGENTISLRGSKLNIEYTKRGKANLKAVEDDPVIELTSDVKVRVMHLPPKTDEKGKKLPYTEKELKDLKGDANLRGYKAETEDLKAGKIVTIHVLRLRGAKGEEAEKRFADRVYIKGEAPLPPESEKKGDRKKDKN